jgi:hypothetical protein
MVEALRYKPEGRRFESRMRWIFFNLPNPSGRTIALGIDSVSNRSTRNLSGGKKRLARRADNLTAICEPMSENVEASISRNPKVLHGLHRDNFTFTLK